MADLIIQVEIPEKRKEYISYRLKYFSEYYFIDENTIRVEECGIKYKKPFRIINFDDTKGYVERERYFESFDELFGYVEGYIESKRGLF